MKIVSIHVVAFGKLKNVKLQLNDSVNVLQHTNGFGKTTLASFIRAMLYGFTYTRAKGATDVSHYAPWGSTEKFGGSIVVEHAGETYRIERFFGATARQETLKMTNEKTGKELNLNVQPGEFLLGLTADSYDRSAYFPQEAVELSSNDNFEGRLANLVQDGAENYDKVQDKLRAYKKNLRYERGYGGKIYELDCAKQELSQKLAEAQLAKRRSVEIEIRLQQIEQEKASLEQRYAESQKKLASLQQDTQTAVVEINKQQKRPIFNKAAIIVGSILIVIGILFTVLGVTKLLPMEICFYIGGIAFGLVWVGLVYLITEHAVEKHRLKKFSNDTQSSTAQREESVMPSPYPTDMQKHLQAIGELANEAGRLTEEKKNLVLDSIAIQDRILAIEEERKVAVRRLEVADYVIKLLECAKDNLSRSYLPKLCARCSQLLQEVTQSDLSVVVDRNFTVSVREKGQTKPMSEFSRGIREIILLCFRVALSELLYDGAIPFVIIDDAFVNFDEPNFVRATTLLKKLSANAQVVYFTCHNRTGNLLK